MISRAQVLDAWQDALAAEQRAAYGYSLLGPRLSTAHQGLAARAQTAHVELCDATATALIATGTRPQNPAADYALGTVADTSAAVALAVRLEDGCAAAWRYLYAQAAGSSAGLAVTARDAAQQALNASAVRAARWTVLVTPAAPTTPFPGI